ncbi:unnamed protein product [Lymnaea stagnalis]|uniref:G-protein coupled receptors family 1 profile domain-containing protein n=1 Tax=Lymnaea stagnalis TaxID=6523 RepID=A0AAV2H9L5_LYMST
MGVDILNNTLEKMSDLVMAPRKYNQLLSDDTRHWFELINLVVLSSALALFGIATNIINVLVFYRQGLNTTVNISFTGLAVSDLCSLVTLLWFNICENPYFAKSDVPMAASEFQHLTGGFPHACFTRITSWITTYIAAERCLCMAFPLRIKEIISPRKATAVIVTIYLWMMISLLPEYITVYIDWKWYPEVNKTLLGLKFTTDRHRVDGLSFLLYAVYMIISFFSVVVLTAILFSKLKRKIEWRHGKASSVKPSESLTRRDKKTMRMVVVIAGVLIVTFMPQVIIFTVGFIEPEFSVVGKYVNFFFMSWSFCFVFDAANSSVSIILYYTMSSKYRLTFHEIFSERSGSRCIKNK